MADEKILNTRIKLKYDTYANWTTANPVLLNGEVAVVVVPASSGAVAQEPAILMKVGDGTTTFNALPYVSGLAGDVYDWAKEATKPTYSASELTGLDAYISKYVNEQMGISVDTNTQYKVEPLEDGMGFVLSSKGKTDGAWTVESTVDFEEKFIKAIATGATNGTIAVDGKEVAVAGLGSAAFTEASAYDVAGSAEAVDTKLTEEIARAKSAEKVNADAIGVLNGNTSVEGSVDKKIADAFNEFATNVTDDGVVNSYKELIDYAATHGAEFTELVGDVNTNTQAIATLNGDATTAGSVDKKISDAISDANLEQYATDVDLLTVKSDLTTEIDKKVDKVEGSRLMTEAEGTKLEDIAEGAQVNVIEKVKVNGVEQTITDKAVDLIIKNNIADLEQTEGTYVIFDCGSATKNI